MRKTLAVMHQSFASPALPGLGNSGALNFSIFKNFGKTPAKSPGSPGADNNVEQQLGVVLMKLKQGEGHQFMHVNV